MLDKLYDNTEKRGTSFVVHSVTYWVQCPVLPFCPVPCVQLIPRVFARLFHRPTLKTPSFVPSTKSIDNDTLFLQNPIYLKWKLLFGLGLPRNATATCWCVLSHQVQPCESVNSCRDLTWQDREHHNASQRKARHQDAGQDRTGLPSQRMQPIIDMLVYALWHLK